MGAGGVFASKLGRVVEALRLAVLRVLVPLGVITIAACGGGQSASPPVPLPVISDFSATKTTVALGADSELKWSTSQADKVTLDNVVVTAQSIDVRPQTTTTYVLTASNSAGQVSASVTVTVGPPLGLVAAPAMKVAREVIVSDPQNIGAPQIDLKFYGDLDARGAASGYQVQFTLSDGEWLLGAHPERALRVENGVTGVVASQMRSVSPSLDNFAYSVDAVGLSADRRTVFFTIKNHQMGSDVAWLQKPLLTLNASKNTINGVAGVDVSTDALRITGLKGLTRYDDPQTADVCVASKKLKVAFQTFVALTAPSSLASPVNATADEHQRSHAVTSIDLVDFVTNIKLAIDPPATSIRTAANRLGFVQPTPGNASYVDANTAMLGKLSLLQNALGRDIGTQFAYHLAGNSEGQGLAPQTVAVLSNGRVEASAFTARITAANGVAVGSTVYLSGAANCASAIAGTELLVNSGNAQGPLDLTIPTEGLASSFGPYGTQPVYVCYRVPANTAVPATDIATKVILSKAAGNELGEQANVCSGRLTSVE
ncbi:MAG: hypothetical protein H7Y28_04275 [Rhodoferax sp.]|nr:hypothetical protein [Rhodoferax sp.]